jgi:hypothetical protein
MAQKCASKVLMLLIQHSILHTQAEGLVDFPRSLLVQPCGGRTKLIICQRKKMREKIETLRAVQRFQPTNVADTNHQLWGLVCYFGDPSK